MRRIPRWACRLRRPTSPTGTASSSTTARRPQADLSGKQVLEVSCGHGGGASYLVRTLHPASYTGLDLNPAGIGFCRKRHNLPGLDFVEGDAENLPFANQSFDVVINVEASHCYPHLPRFFAEVARALRPGGHFVYTDLRDREAIPAWEAAIEDAPMRLHSDRVVSGGGSARAGEEFAAVSGHDRSHFPGLPAPLRPRRIRRARLAVLPRPTMRADLVPDVLLRQGLKRRSVPAVDSWAAAPPVWAAVGGHGKLPSDGHVSARWRS